MMELSHYEAAQKGNVNDLPFTYIGREGMSDVFNRVSPSGNSLLHVAARAGNKDITSLILHHYPHLVTTTNAQGDTPLHAATRFGRLNTSIVLVTYTNQQATSSNANDGLLRMKNGEENTPLHNALMAIRIPLSGSGTRKSPMKSFESEALVRYLISADSETCYCQNKIGKSPLCMAVEFGQKEIVEYILEALPATDNSYEEKLQGKSPVHVAIQQRKFGMLKLIMRLKPRFFLIQDEKGNTPLHLAAWKGYLRGVRYLIEQTNNDALQRNKKGLYPLHVACKHGHIQVIEELIKIWPDPFELLTNKGQNILHVAAENGKLKVVSYILSKANGSKLVNQVDNDGNTALHLAASRGYCSVVYRLMKKADRNLVNYQGQIPCDLGEQHFLLLDSPTTDQDNKRWKRYSRVDAMMTISLFYVNLGNFRRPITRKPINPRIRIKLLQKEDIRNRINNLLVVATLIVGAAFAVSVQLPNSGDNLSDENKIKVENYLHSFVNFDALALNISTLAAFLLCWALLVDVALASTISWFAFGLLEFSLFLLNSAFSYAINISMISNPKSTFSRSLQSFFTNIFALNLGLALYVLLSWNESSIIVLYIMLFGFRTILCYMWSAFVDTIALLVRFVRRRPNCG